MQLLLIIPLVVQCHTRVARIRAIPKDFFVLSGIVEWNGKTP